VDLIADADNEMPIGVAPGNDARIGVDSGFRGVSDLKTILVKCAGTVSAAVKRKLLVVIETLAYNARSIE
jgi:hypothetical protein